MGGPRTVAETPFMGGPGRTEVDAWDPTRNAPPGYEASVRAFQDLRRVLMDASLERAAVSEVLYAVEELEWALDASRSWGPDRLEGLRARLEVARIELGAYLAREADTLPVLVRLRLSARAQFFGECALFLQAETERSGQLPR